MAGVSELFWFNGYGSYFLADSASREVSYFCALCYAETGGDAERQEGDDRVSGARDVCDFKRCGRYVRKPVVENRDSFLASGDDKVSALHFFLQFPAGFFYLFAVVGEHSSQGGGNFRKVRFEHSAALVIEEALELRIHKYRDIVFPGQ